MNALMYSSSSATSGQGIKNDWIIETRWGCRSSSSSSSPFSSSYHVKWLNERTNEWIMLVIWWINAEWDSRSQSSRYLSTDYPLAPEKLIGTGEKRRSIVLIAEPSSRVESSSAPGVPLTPRKSGRTWGPETRYLNQGGRNAQILHTLGAKQNYQLLRSLYSTFYIVKVILEPHWYGYRGAIWARTQSAEHSSNLLNSLIKRNSIHFQSINPVECMYTDPRNAFDTSRTYSLQKPEPPSSTFSYFSNQISQHLSNNKLLFYYRGIRDLSNSVSIRILDALLEF